MKTYTKANKLNTLTILTLLWLGSFGVFGQVNQEADWKWQNPLPTGNTLYDVQFLDSQIGWAVGASGTILKTTNGGSQWFNQGFGNTKNLYSEHFSDPQTGWAVGDAGTIIKTSNGGSNWISQNSGTTQMLRSIHFSDSQMGWAVGLSGTIMKTTNGGSSWINQSSGTAQMLSSVQFIDAQTGWVVGQNGIILKTINGGSDWLSQNSGTSNLLSSIHFNDAQTGWAVGDSGTIIKTSNGGSNWIIQSSGITNNLTSVHFADAQTGSSVGPSYSILKTTNGGSSWQSRFIGTYLRSVHFTDAQNGWAVGDGGAIMYTNNGGNSWLRQTSGTTNVLSSVYFTDTQNGWAVGDGGAIMYTNNGGNSWSRQTSGTTKWLFSVHFIDTQNAWAVGSSGAILKTSNAGSNWQSQSSGTTNNLYSVHFNDAQSGWAVGYGNTILKTINGGSTWQIQSSGTTNYLQSVHFADSQNGWAVGQLGTILKTSNGGSNWISQSSGTSEWLRSVHFIDSQTGWAVGRNGIILKTSNGGSNWQSQSSGTSEWLRCVYFTDAQYGWAVGEYGTILTKNGLSADVPSSLLSGTISQKKNTNCNPNPLAPKMQGMVVKAMPGPYYGVSNDDGMYSLRLPIDTQSVSNISISALPIQYPTFSAEPVCPLGNAYTVTLDSIPDTLSGRDFSYTVTPCHHLDVQLASNRRRRCFQNTTSISYQNQGSLSAPDAYLLVEFPHWVRPVSASRNHVAVNDSVWRFNLDTVSAGESGSFTITDSVICGNLGILGLSQCTKATIFPAPDCPPPPGYNGAEVTVSGKCNNGFVSLGIYNKSNTDMVDSVNYWVYLDSIQVKQAKVKLAAGDSLKLWVETQGLAVHLTVNQVQNHPTELFVSTTVESCGDTFIFYPRQTVNRFAKQQRPNSKTHCLPVIGAYDPNDKQAFPIGFTNQNIIPPNTQLEYLVRFQNTGNDTAFTVYVIDTLDNNLNPETIELGAASHNYQLSMQTVKSGKTFLRWQFNNIQLPDSNVNEPASNGFIQFRISPKSGLALGSKVRNHAEIYFDFNPPIITNQTMTTYNLITFRDTSLNNNVQIVTAAKGKLSPKQIGVNLYPNPVTEHSLTADFSTKGSFTLFNAQGQLVFEKSNIEGKQVLPIQLRTGFYMAQLRTEKGVSVVKVVVEAP